ncbi:MAG: class I SAM-dependent RNA methyltransferase [Anaerolineales bacterium]|nr:class I SAM-dependent RNA methyltransferase [Anaerolineales bacterium]
MSQFYAACPPGLEELVAQELRSLGCAGLSPRTGDRDSDSEGGGVSVEGDLETLYRLNLHLRTASRVLARLGEFYAASFAELHQQSSRLEWERYLNPGGAVRLNVTCHKSRLYHSEAVAERVLKGIAQRLGKTSPALRANEQPEARAQLVIVRLVKDRCTISVDASGELLHRRGYRLAGAKAPLRENLAAALLLACGWETGAPLLDPFCGSGTIAIEAALLAGGIPPGRNRRFAFMDWRDYDAALWERVRQSSLDEHTPVTARIQASDRDAGAVQTARENARRAGVLDVIEFSQRALSAVEPPAGPGWVVTNPPFGVRVSQRKDLRNLYAQLGNVLRRRCPGWQAAVLGNDPRLFSQIGFPLKTALATQSGGLNVQLRIGKAPEA